MKLYIVRHGETDQNVKKIIQGQSHTKLNKKGKLQASLIAQRLKIVNFDYVYSSDLLRAKQTTKEIMKYQNCPVKYVKELREKSFGRLQGEPIKNYYDHLSEDIKRSRPDYRIPGGESPMDFYLRLIKFIEMAYHKHKNQTILFSTHGGAARFIFKYLKNIPLTEKGPVAPGNTSLTIVQFHEKGRHKIELEGCIKHLNVLKAK